MELTGELMKNIIINFPMSVTSAQQVYPNFARQVIVSGYQTPNMTFNILSTREMSPIVLQT